MAGQPGRGGDAPADPAGRAGTVVGGVGGVGGRDDSATAASDSRDGAAAEPGGADSGDALAARLAEIWAMIAEADPELAKRVPGYLTAAD